MDTFYKKGETLGCYKWMFQNQQLVDCQTFSKFRPPTYENHQAQLFKLKHHGSVLEYQANFEKLGNTILGLPPDVILNCFISCLILEIRN